MGRKPKSNPSFFKIALGDFTNHFRVPQAFVNNFKQLLPKKLLLQISWRFWAVEMKVVENGLFFGKGWSVFVKENFIELGDLLVFRLVNSSVLHVTVYDKTCCKKNNSEVNSSFKRTGTHGKAIGKYQPLYSKFGNCCGGMRRKNERVGGGTKDADCGLKIGCLCFTSIFRQAKRQKIPRRLVRKLGDELSNVASLKVPGGDSCEVQLKKSNNKVFLKKGWQNFATTHSICDGQRLVFRYIGNSCFDVLKFDFGDSDGRELCDSEGPRQPSNMDRSCKVYDKEMDDEVSLIILDEDWSENGAVSRIELVNNCEKLRRVNKKHRELMRSDQEEENDTDMRGDDPKHKVPAVFSSRPGFESAIPLHDQTSLHVRAESVHVEAQAPSYQKNCGRACHLVYQRCKRAEHCGRACSLRKEGKEEDAALENHEMSIIDFFCFMEEFRKTYKDTHRCINSASVVAKRRLMIDSEYNKNILAYIKEVAEGKYDRLNSDKTLKSNSNQLQKMKRPADKPKRPVGPFFVFMEQFRKTYMHKSTRFVPEISKAAGEKWNSMSDTEKACYVTEARKRKSQYYKNLKAYHKELAEGSNSGDGEGSCDSENELNSTNEDEVGNNLVDEEARKKNALMEGLEENDELECVEVSNVEDDSSDSEEFGMEEDAHKDDQEMSSEESDDVDYEVSNDVELTEDSNSLDDDGDSNENASDYEDEADLQV